MPTPREITVEEVEAYLRDEAKEMDAKHADEPAFRLGVALVIIRDLVNRRPGRRVRPPVRG